MDENNDFVIDTGMPVGTPLQEECNTCSSDVYSPVLDECVQGKDEDSMGHTSTENPEMSVLTDEDIDPTSMRNDLDLAYVASLIEKLEKKFDEKIAVDEHKNILFDKLYKERDEYKNDLYAKLLKPFIVGAIDLINDLRSYISKMDMYDVERSLGYLRTLPDDIVELLENNGVELFSEETDVFNPRTQRAKKVVITEDKDANNKIAERLEKGYRWHGVVVRPEIVTVYKNSNRI